MLYISKETPSSDNMNYIVEKMESLVSKIKKHNMHYFDISKQHPLATVKIVLVGENETINGQSNGKSRKSIPINCYRHHYL